MQQFRSFSLHFELYMYKVFWKVCWPTNSLRKEKKRLFASIRLSRVVSDSVETLNSDVIQCFVVKPRENSALPLQIYF